VAVDDALAWLMRARRAGRPRDPAVMRALLERLGAPQPPRVLHVVGTNGKGTVTHYLAAMAQRAGERVGRFTSPHVEHFRERIAIDDVAIDDAAIERFVARVRRWDLPGIGFFEWSLALAVEVFAERGVTLAVVEAGVGAKHDATMALPGVIGAVLTNVDLDHVETLGPTLADIARDKAAVARPGVPLVIGVREPERAIVVAQAERVGALVTIVDADQPLARLPAGVATPFPPTRAEGARLALALGRLLGWPEAALAAGLASAPPPARYERFEVDCKAVRVAVILDGAHDPAAAARLATALPEGYVLLFGSLERKRDLPTLAPLRAQARSVHLVPAEVGEGPPPHPAEAGAPTSTYDDVAAGLDAALAEGAACGAVVAIAGSLHLAGVVRPLLRARSTEARGSGW
jgi:dihydrofolate synthase / folylpolyglutamate synthase